MVEHKKTPLTTENPVYKPFRYPWAFELWEAHEAMHWLPKEVPLAEDVKDWATKITEQERNLLTQIFRFFTQQDVVVGGAYLNHYLKVFQPTEVRMMLSGFAARELIHIAAYSHLLDTIGIPEIEYAAFLEYKQMKEKFEYAQKFNTDTPAETAKALAAFSGFMEGLQLFASFAMLLNFPRFNKMKGMGQIVTWSIKDETCFSSDTHILTESGWKLFKNLEAGDKVAQWANGVISFVSPERIIEKPATEMVHFHNEKSSVDQLVTKNHRVLFYDESEGVDKVKSAEEFNPHSRNFFYTCGKKDGEVRHLTAAEQVLIALQADGTILKGNECGYRRVTFSLTKDRKKDRLQRICSEAGFNCTALSGQGDEVIYAVDIPVQYPTTKNFSGWVDYSAVDSTWCSEFVEELVEWDGHRIAGGDTHYYYSSVVEDNVVVAQTIAALAGYHTSKKVQYDPRKDSYKPVHRLYITKDKQKTRTGSTVKETVGYEGNVYCVTVPSGFVVVKRNDCIVISGNCHVDGMVKLFRTYIEENIEIWNDDLKKQIYDICRQMVEHEDHFIDLAFELGGVQGMTAEDIKQYIRYIADRRLVQLGLKPNYGVSENPLPWVDEMVNAPEFTNFFEQRVTEYARAISTGDWEDAFEEDKWEVFGQAGCGQCLQAKALLEMKKQTYEYFDLTNQAKRKMELYEETQARSMPMIFLNDKYFGGWPQLEAHFKGK